MFPTAKTRMAINGCRPLCPHWEMQHQQRSSVKAFGRPALAELTPQIADGFELTSCNWFCCREPYLITDRRHMKQVIPGGAVTLSTIHANLLSPVERRSHFFFHHCQGVMNMPGRGDVCFWHIAVASVREAIDETRP